MSFLSKMLAKYDFFENLCFKIKSNHDLYSTISSFIKLTKQICTTHFWVNWRACQFLIIILLISKFSSSFASNKFIYIHCDDDERHNWIKIHSSFRAKNCLQYCSWVKIGHCSLDRQLGFEGWLNCQIDRIISVHPSSFCSCGYILFFRMSSNILKAEMNWCV